MLVILLKDISANLDDLIGVDVWLFDNYYCFFREDASRILRNRAYSIEWNVILKLHTVPYFYLWQILFEFNTIETKKEFPRIKIKFL